MATEEQSAHGLVEQLREEIGRAELSDPAARERLTALVGKLDERLEAEHEDDHQELLDELKEEAVEFGVEHPRIASTLRGLLRMLSSIGI